MSEPAIEIFREGTHTALSGTRVTVSAADLKAAAEAYDVAKHEAPIVVGHPKLDAPAYGWVSKLIADGGVLKAVPGQVDTAFAELVRGGRFKKISAAFYPPNSPDNPKPGTFYLRHVGFLGAMPPAVRGLKAVQFAGNAADVLEFAMSGSINASMWRRMREFILARFGTEVADQVLPGWEIDRMQEEAIATTPHPAFSAPAPSPTQEGTMSDETTKKKQAELDAKAEELKRQELSFAEREKAITDRESQAARSGFEEFAEGLVKAGKLLPKDKAGIIEVLTGIPKATVLEFAEGDKKTSSPAVEWLKTFLSALPKQVEFAERGAGGSAPSTDPADIAARARAYVEEQAKVGHVVSTTEAVRKVTAG